MEAIKLKGKIDKNGSLSIFPKKSNLTPGDVEVLILYSEETQKKINKPTENTFLSVIGKGKIDKIEPTTSKEIDKIIYG
jgi:hypothetical protein